MAYSFRAILLATACATALSGPATAQSVVSFGDSLSDTGNVFTLTRGAQPASPPYFQGRFSNGPVFTEVLAGGAGSMANAGARALLRAPIDPNASQNYAFGGALSGQTPLGTVPVGARSQIELFAARDGRFAPDDLVTLLAGANDLRGALIGSPAAIPAVTAASVNDIALASGRLAQLGAPSVAVLTLPDLSLTPEVRAAGPLAASLASQATRGFNAGVAQGVSRVAAASPQTNFHLVDVQPLFAEIATDPARFGFANVTQACLAVAACAGGTSDVQNGFLFFDTIHPTARGHQLLAGLVSDHLTAGARAGDAASLSEVGIADRLAGEAAVRERARGHLARTGAIAQGADLIEPGSVSPFWGNAYLSVEGMAFDRDVSAPTASYDYRAGAVRLGGDHRPSDSLLLGGAVSASRGEVDDARLSYDTRSFSADVYATAVFGAAFVTASGGLSHHDFDDFRRRTSIGGIVNRGDTADGFSGNLGLEAGYGIEIGRFTATPTLGLTYVHFDVDGFQETGSGARIVYGGYDRDVLLGAANLDLAYETSILARRSLVSARIGYEDTLSDDGDGGIASSVANSPSRASFAAFDDLPGRGFILGAGAKVDLSERLGVEAKYSVGFGDEIDISHSGAFGLSYRF